MKKWIVVFLISLSLATITLATRIDVWFYGFTNEMAKVVSGMIDEEFTPKTGIGKGNASFLGFR